ncbi:MAG TPA: aspartate--ammonia ligase [Firmicutes bacterium]|nr:aspartate--ammonia ligase [Bacillota bacterium]
MSTIRIPDGYTSDKPLTLLETQKAIDIIKLVFIRHLKSALCLTRVSAPLFVADHTGLNDDLNNVERAVCFDIKETGGTAQVVQSLAKWKRYALGKYGFAPGTGLVTDMNAIRRDEEMDNLHSIYVDQWDWEAVLPEGKRNKAYLMETVQKIVDAICDTAEELHVIFPSLGSIPSRSVSFITTQELEDLYPDATPQERENRYVREHKTAFIMEIGGKLRSGIRHDGRAPDYDDWKMNGDIIMWNDTLGQAFEVSSMGIRVDAASMDQQLTLAGCDERRLLPFHKMVLDGTLPLTIGGGIGQSRLCMLLLHKAHIGEVQVSIWDDKTVAACKAAGIRLL